MRAVLMKVSSASVKVDDTVCGKIGEGFLILLGVAPEDTETEAKKLADKLCSLRIFDDENGKINRSLDDVHGEILVISQFTLYGNCRHGAVPIFSARQDPKLPSRSTKNLSHFAAKRDTMSKQVFLARTWRSNRSTTDLLRWS